MRIVVIDNYDSFTYNLVQYLGELGAEPCVYRNDAIAADDRRLEEAAGLMISPGPGNPDGAGVSMAMIAKQLGRLPILGVCLGHQCLAQVLGGRIERAGRIMHGKTSRIEHDGDGVFHGLPNPFEATRYHSLVVDTESVPASLRINARTADGEIMGLTHREHAAHGVQFHPESILTECGHQLVQNFLDMCAEPAATR